MGVDLLNLAAQWIENDAAKLFKKKDSPEIDVFYVGLGKTGSSSFEEVFSTVTPLTFMELVMLFGVTKNFSKSLLMLI